MNRSLCRPLTRSILCFALVSSFLILAGCSDAPDPAPLSRDSHNADIDIRISGLGDLWSDPVNTPTGAELNLAAPDRQGTVRISVGPEETGVNLVAKVDEHRAHILAQQNGIYSGAQELTGPLGVAFYSRGQYMLDGLLTEETIIVALHPRASRALRLTYVYPAADDSSQRVSELIELFSSVE